MVSLDPRDRNREFAESHGATFPVLSDPTGEAARAYGVLRGGFARRWTFYIDAAGIIRRIDRDVRAASHGGDVARALGELGFPRTGSR